MRLPTTPSLFLRTPTNGARNPVTSKSWLSSSVSQTWPCFASSEARFPGSELSFLTSSRRAVSVASFSMGSVLRGQHDRYDGLCVVAWATEGIEGNEGRVSFAVVVTDMQGEVDALAIFLLGSDGEAEHVEDVPKAAGFVLTINAGRDGD